MSIIVIILCVILLLSMIYVGDEKGLHAFYSLIANVLILYVLFRKISVSDSPVTLTLIFCGIMSAVTLISLNGFKRKTFTALISVGIIIVVMACMDFIFAPLLHIQGFDPYELEKIECYSTNVNISFPDIVICEMLIAIFSSITDTAITISSSMNEICQLNPEISRSDLLNSGMNIGNDILGTTVNTLFFVYFGNMLILLIWFSIRNVSFSSVINSKLLAEIIFDIVMSSTGVILVIPVTALISSVFFKTEYGKK